uniref:Uncharacterized protein n=1 Tax=Nelumbo nucifera TaxID=4432 RepID=A0A822Z8E4_NELNU|nr:TPA_asm: hypothetical protein HUJ06_015193 [Nelumbo nucifera]
MQTHNHTVIEKNITITSLDKIKSKEYLNHYMCSVKEKMNFLNIL